MTDNLIYTDTNVINKMANQLDLRGLIELRMTVLEAGIRPVLSPVNIVEILGTEDESQREKIIIACQHFFEPDLLAEPETLLVDYIVEHLDVPEVQHLRLESQFGVSELAGLWREVQADKSRTLLASRDDLQRIEVFKALHSYFHAYYSRGNRLPDLTLHDVKIDHNINENLLCAARDLRNEAVPLERMAILCENRTLMILTILCAGLSPFPQSIVAFWDALGIDLVQERYDFVISRLGFLNEEGPIMGLGSFMGWQATKKHSKGNFYDCMHFMYLPYVSKLVTEDVAFHEYKQDYPDSSILDRIVRSDVLYGNGRS